MAADLFAGARVLQATPALRERTVAGAIYVGVEPKDCVAGLQAVADGYALLLTKKARDSHTHKSVASFASGVDVEACRAQMGLGRNPAQPFDGLSLIIEDASPDTCLSLVTLARRLQGQQVPSAWIDAASAWELGFATRVSPETADWAQLTSALGHASSSEDGAHDLIKSLRLCCTMTDGLIAWDLGPDAPPPLIADPTLHAHVSAARALIAAELEKCKHIGDFAEVVQLSIPQVLVDQRRIVDGVLMVERNITGVLKSALRQDTASPGGAGYAFLGIHRPTTMGEGNDITFSVNPQSSLSLKDLWQALEEREWATWERAGEVRPQDFIRDMAHVADVGVRGSNQPWWITPEMSLVAAPRRQERPGAVTDSKLKWTDALDVVWRLYAPIKDFDFRDKNGAAIGFFDGYAGVARESVTRHEPKYVCSMQAGPGRKDARWSETVARACAAFVLDGRARIDRLPDIEDFTEVQGRGGVVVVTEHGAAIVQLREGEDFPRQEVYGQVTYAAQRLDDAKQLERDLEKVRAQTSDTIQSMHRKSETLAQIHAILTRALKCSSQKSPRSPDPYIARVQKSLEDFWSADNRFESVVREANALRDTIVSASDVQTNDLVHAVAVYGFAFALLVNVAFSSPVTSLVEHLLPAFADNIVIKIGVLSFLWITLSGALALFVWAFSGFGRRAWSRRVRRGSDT